MARTEEEFWPSAWQFLSDDQKREILIKHGKCGFLRGPLRWHTCRLGHRLIPK